MTLFSPDRWQHYTIRMPMMERNACLRYAIPIWKHTYQIKLLDDKGSEVLYRSKPYSTTRIDTPFYSMVGYFPRRDRWRRGIGKADVYGDR